MRTCIAARALHFPAVMKKLVWTALVTAASAMTAALVARVLDRAWRRIVKEAPPEMPRWARMLVGKPLKGQIERRVHDTAL